MLYFRNVILLLFFTCSIALSSCQFESREKTKPNIPWIFLEDTSPLLSCYGEPIISTPNIDKLAENGILFKKVDILHLTMGKMITTLTMNEGICITRIIHFTHYTGKVV